MGLFDKIKHAFVKENEEEKNQAPLSEEESVTEDLEKPAEEAADSAETAKETVEESEERLAESSDEDSASQLPEATAKNLQEEADSIVSATEEQTQTAAETLAETVSTQAKYEKGLQKTRKTFKDRMNELFANFRSVDEEFFEEVEDTLIGADVGFETSMKIADEL